MIDLNRKRKKPLIAMSSMSDIGFLLLIFIMLISLINQKHEEPIEYPEAQMLEKTETSDNMEIWIEKSGIISVQGSPVTINELEILIADALAKEAGTRVHIIADKQTPYRYIDSVVKILQILQHRVVSFVVREEL